MKPSQRPRAVVAARVSVDDFGKGKRTKEEQAREASISIESQVTPGLALADHAGYELVCEPLVDDGVSGFKGAERAGFDKLMRLIVGGHVDVVICRAVDRLGRNDVDNSAIRIAATKAGVRFHLLTGGIIDPGESGGKLSLQMMQSVAEYQSALKSETLRNVYEGMRAKGTLRATTKTFGWQWEKGKPERSMLAEPVERAAIQRAYRDLLNLDDNYVKRQNGTAASLYSIIQRWNSDPALTPVRRAKAWSYASVRAALLRPSNAGYVTDGAGGWLTSADDDGQPIRGQWEALVPEAVYLEARALLTSAARRTAPGRKSAYLASGIVKCGVCGDVLRSSTIQGKRDEHDERIPIYRCVSKLAFVADPGKRHVSARITDHELTTKDPATGKPRISRGLDWAVREAAVAAFAFGPENLFPQFTPDLTNAVYAELERVEAAIREIGLALEDGAKYASVGPNLKRQEARKAKLLQELGTAAASEAQGAMLTDIRHGVRRAGRVDVAAFAEYRAELGRTFDALPIEQRRELVRALLDITVLPLGPKVYGARRWRIIHKVVTSLNVHEVQDAP
ncbi:recombinase family protein [Microbacterium sp. NPDC089987]|uniref:recombinase family protein n=1 Tax=Microbacterium sp. NPDC089987 TaxID=3364202 RepID=UPI00380ADDF8